MEGNNDRKIYYTYRMFKKLTEERRWFTKLFVLLSKEEWESCGKGILKFYQVDGGHLIDIKRKEDINKNIDNLYLIIDTSDVKDNLNKDLLTAQKHQNILKTKEFDQSEIICFYNLRYGHNFSKDREKVIRWCHLYPDNENQQIALSFNDEVALFHAWKIFCEFKNIPSQHPIPIPSKNTIDDIIKDLTEKIYLNDDYKSKEMYIHFYSEDEFFTKKLFEMAEKAEKASNFDLLKKVAKVVKLLISFSSKPDIILQFVSDQNYKIFFNCLKYMEENNNKEFENLLEKFQITDINNIFNIKDVHILETIKINYRIIFLKEIILPDLFSQDQSNDITNYLLLHGNNIIVYIIDNMEDFFSNIIEQIKNNTKKVNDFFHELSYILRLYSFPIIKDEFSNTFVNFGYHLSIADLLIIKTTSGIAEKDIEVIILCLEILKLICKENSVILVDIFLYKNNQEVGILDNLIQLVETDEKNIFEIIIDMFRSLNMTIQKEINEEYIDFILKKLIPKIKKKTVEFFEKENIRLEKEFLNPKFLKNKDESHFEENQRIVFKEEENQPKFSKNLFNFVFFALEIFNQLFIIKNEKIQECLFNQNILNNLIQLINPSSPKIFQIYFCSYLRNIIDLKNKNTTVFDFEKTLEIFWQIFTNNMKIKRFNLLKSLNFAILNSISFSEINEFIKKIACLVKNSKFKEIPILREILNKAKLQGLLNDMDSKITSESECSLRPKSEKTKTRQNLIETFIFEDEKLRSAPNLFLQNNKEKINSLNQKIEKMKEGMKNEDLEKEQIFDDDDLLVKRKI